MTTENQALTNKERACCHMRDAEIDWREGALAQWRQEFQELPRSEKCRDCPAA